MTLRTRPAPHDRHPRRRGFRLPAPIALLFAFGAVPGMPLVADVAAASTPAAYAANRELGRGMNLGNALEAPRDARWALSPESPWFEEIAAAGFDSVRIPIRWSDYTMNRSPWTIEESAFEEVDRVLDLALGLTSDRPLDGELSVILDMHHDESLMDDPEAEKPRFLAMWKQIASRYSNRPENVLFELLNEPHGRFDEEGGDAIWNRMLADALRVVRRDNPDRVVLVGPVGSNAIGRLDDLELPEDPNLIVSVHYYDPLPFTHQGARWTERRWRTGTLWKGSHVVAADVANTTEDESWRTKVASGSGRLTVRHGGKAYAGFVVRSSVPALAPTRLELRVRGALDVSIGCRSGDMESFSEVDTLARSGDAWGTHSVNLSACPAGTDRIALMSRTDRPAPYELAEMRLCDGSRGCRLLVGAARDLIARDLDAAAAWGRTKRRPMHLGEFGAYERADFGSRVNWTREVRKAADAAGLSNAYWEFGSGFGAYDLKATSWRPRLLRALMP